MNWLWVYKIIPQGSCCIGIPCAVASNAASTKWDTAVLFLIRFARISQTSCFHFLLAFVSIFGASFCKHKLSGCSHEFSEILGDKDQDHTKYMYVHIYIYIHTYPEKMFQKWHVLQQSFTGNTANNVVFALFSLFLLQATKLECVAIAGVLGCSLLHNAVNSFLLCKGATQCCKYAENIWKCKHVWLHGGEDLANNNVNNVQFDTICCM